MWFKTCTSISKGGIKQKQFCLIDKHLFFDICASKIQFVSVIERSNRKCHTLFMVKEDTIYIQSP